jgi:DnaJ-class molecular chaperone
MLSKQYHPDKTRGDKAAEKEFKDITEANEVLSDPVKRQKYDQFGADWKQYEEAGGSAEGGHFVQSPRHAEFERSGRNRGSRYHVLLHQRP